MTEKTKVKPAKQKKRGFPFKEYVLNITNVEKRDFGLDLVKVIAMVFVLSIHFFLYNGHFYNYIIGSGESAGFIIAAMARDLCYTCVPLFLMVSGALSCYKPADLSKKHYVRITPVLVNSLIIGLLVIVFQLIRVSHGATDANLTPYRLLRGLWSGTLPEYGWYVNMYVTLFVFMPILDIAYNALNSQKKKTFMIIALIVITFIPQSLNRYSFEETSLSIMPNFFAYNFWPAAYYMIGKYIKDFDFKVNRILSGGGLVFCLLYQAFGIYFIGQEKTFYEAFTVTNGDFITMATAVCLFLLIYNINTKNITIRSIFASLSSLTLSVYLLSWFGDMLFYYKLGDIFNPTPESFGDYIINYLRVVPFNLVISILGAYTVGVLVKLISRPLMRLMLNHSIVSFIRSKMKKFRKR